MSEEYHLIGNPIDSGNCPSVFELRLDEYLLCIDPQTFKLSTSTPSINPNDYFITSGDALSKAIKLEKDMWALATKLRKKYTKTKKNCKKTVLILDPKYKKYVEAVWKCAGQCRSMVNRLYEAKGKNCFLETEWREQKLIVIPKNPRLKPNIVHAK